MEKIDVLDEFGIRTGEILSRKEIHKLGKIHRAIHLYLFDKSNNLLIQKRSINTDHFAEMYSISMAGHIEAGENSFKSLKRETKEELGLNPDKMNFEFLFSFRQYHKISPEYIDHQFNDVYYCWHDFKIEDIKYDTNSISEIKLISIQKFQSMIDKKSKELAPVYSKEFKDVIYFLKNHF